MYAASDCCEAWSLLPTKQSKKPFDPELNFAGRVTAAALRRGLLVYPIQGCVDGVSGDHLLIAPPAVITAEQIDWAVQQLKKPSKKQLPPDVAPCRPSVRRFENPPGLYLTHHAL